MANAIIPYVTLNQHGEALGEPYQTCARNQLFQFVCVSFSCRKSVRVDCYDRLALCLQRGIIIILDDENFDTNFVDQVHFIDNPISPDTRMLGILKIWIPCDNEFRLIVLRRLDDYLSACFLDIDFDVCV
jgi:hypothetical protein